MKVLINKRFYLLFILSIFITFMLTNDTESKYQKVFFDHSITSIDGSKINLDIYKNKVILLVNVASNCGFTKQYADLQELWELYKDKGLIVLGVPSNQFGSQEPGTNEQIKKFCKVNFNISFPMTEKFDVKGDNAHIIYKWSKANYGNSAVPKWNFHKILIGKDGKIIDTYSSFTKPMSKKIINKIKKALN
tara:strand:- start:86 stop:658 length:573 start_codon:yes stop_codon:yes gene_type:complete